MKYIFLIALLFVIVSCDSDATKNKRLTKDQIEGFWQIDTAIKNGRATKLLSKGFYEFTADQCITNINVTMDTMRNNYSLSNNEIKTDQAKYVVEYVNQDTLVFTTKLKNYNYHFTLLKQKEN